MERQFRSSRNTFFEAVTEFNKLCFARDNGAAIDSVFITVGEAYENFCTIADQYSSSIPPTQAGERDRVVTTVQDAHLQWDQVQKMNVAYAGDSPLKPEQYIDASSYITPVEDASSSPVLAQSRTNSVAGAGKEAGDEGDSDSDSESEEVDPPAKGKDDFICKVQELRD